MKCSVNQDPARGRILWMTDGRTRVGAALDYGIRILHLSCEGMENLFYQQPPDGRDGLTTEQGWRIRGGHRLWLSPESEKTYWPDNEPVRWERRGGAVVLTQPPDAALGLRKSIRIAFLPDGQVELEHRVENTARLGFRGALWGVNTLDGGGTARIPFGGAAGSAYRPHSLVSLWGDTSLGDKRLEFRPGSLTVRHRPLEAYCKLGLYCRAGTAVLENKGQRLILGFGAGTPEAYPDLGCNFEVYLNQWFLELETLGPVQRIAPGQQASHVERGRLERL